MSETVDLLVGKIGKAHGLRGDLTIDVRTDEPDRRFATGTVFSTRRGPLTVAASRWHSSRLLIRFAEVPDRNVAETLRGTELRVEVEADERPEDPEEFYDHQLVGLQVRVQSGDVVGEVAEVVHLPSQDLLVVRRPESEGAGEGEGPAMVPFVHAFVVAVDLAARQLVVDDTAGLFREEPASQDVESS